MQPSTTLQPPTFVDLNVLPEELQTRRYPTWYVLGVVALLAVGLLLIPLNRVQQAGSAETARLQAELRLITEELTRIQIDFGGARELQEQLQTTEAAIARLNEERQVVLGDPQGLSTDLPAIMLALPPGTRLESVTGSDGQLTLTGQASSATAALEYAGALQRDGGFSRAQVASLAIAGGQQGDTVMTFTIEAAR